MQNLQLLELVKHLDKKNIYDMAGNVWEWTMENCISYRTIRGGAYNESGLDIPASYRNPGNMSSSYLYRGFRVALYIK